MMYQPKKERWHVGKEIPLALLFAVFCQTIGFVYWLASFSATVTNQLENLSFQLAAVNADKYTKTDAQKDGALYMQNISEVRGRIERLENVKFTGGKHGN